MRPRATATPDVDHDLREANSLSLIYEDFARVARLAGKLEDADALDAKRLALWKRWNERHPNNPFVLRRLAAIDRAAGADIR
jgi:hypothetical protein